METLASQSTLESHKFLHPFIDPSVDDCRLAHFVKLENNYIR